MSENFQRPGPELYDAADSDNVCFLCERPRYKLLYEPTRFGFPFKFQRCECGVIKQTPMPNERFFEWFFNSENFVSSEAAGLEYIWGYYDYFKDEPCRMATSRLRYRQLRRVFEDRGPLDVMKVGPSTGTFLHVAARHGHRVSGCDVSTRFVEFARKNYGVKIDNGRFEKLGYADSSFDVILLLSVIENIPNQVEFLNAVRRRLRSGGRFIFNFVDMKRNLVASMQRERYFIFRPPICYAFERRAIEALMAKFGFAIESTHRDFRFVHLKKVFTLMSWNGAYKAARALRLDSAMFPIYAYPSSIVVARKIG